MKYLLDSNTIIYHLNGEKVVTDFIENNIESCAISQISYVEVLSFNFENEEIRSEVKDFLECLEIIDTNKSIAIQCLHNRKNRKIKIPDNFIASTAQTNNLILVTRNVDDFKNIDVELMNLFES